MRQQPKKNTLAPETRSMLRHALWGLAVAAAALLVPARFTAPLRSSILQPAGPLLEAAFDSAGDAAEGAGALRQRLLSREQSPPAEQDLIHLKNQNVALKEALEHAWRTMRDYEALQSAGTQFQALSAKVISYDTAPGRGSVIVSAGSGDGLRGGELVTAAGAVVGLVEQTGARSSRVRLLTDPRSRIPVRSQRTRIMYVLRGVDGIRCELELADRDQDVRSGDVLVTAPSPGPGTPLEAAPSGLPVARVVSVKRDEGRPLLSRVHADPLVRLDRLEHVLVIRRTD